MNKNANPDINLKNGIEMFIDLAESTARLQKHQALNKLPQNNSFR